MTISPLRLGIMFYISSLVEALFLEGMQMFVE